MTTATRPPTTRSRGRRLLQRALTGIVALAVGGACAAAAYAAFSTSTSTAGSSFAAGTVSLTDNDGGSAMLSLVSAVPGAQDTSCIRTSYSGSLQSTVRHHAAVTGSLAPYLSLKVTRGSGATGFDNCTGFTPDTTDYLGAGAGVIYNGKLSAYPTSYAAGIVDPDGDTYRSAVMGTSGLIGYWRFGESSGTTAADEKGTNPGVYWPGSGYTLGRPGPLTRDSNTAVELDGVTGFAYVPDSAAVKPTAAVSIEAWVKPDSLTGTRWLVVKDTLYYLYIADGSLIFGVATSTLGYQWVQSTAITTGSWQHLVGTYDGTRLNLYRNGVSIASGSASGPIATATGALFFGVYGPPAAGYYDGQLDEIALYGSGLSADTVAQHYNAGLDTEVWTNPESHDYKFELTMDNDLAVEGLSATATFTWEARNT
jgi:hypothetical protein